MNPSGRRLDGRQLRRPSHQVSAILRVVEAENDNDRGCHNIGAVDRRRFKYDLNVTFFPNLLQLPITLLAFNFENYNQSLES